MKASRLFVGFGALMAASFAFVSCSENNNLYDPSYEEQLAKEKYSEAFTKRYGDINPTQSWDFTAGSIYYLGDAPAARAGEPMDIKVETSAGFVFNIAPTFRDAMVSDFEALPYVGKPFYLSATGDDITIMPVYQNVSNAWSLYMVIQHDGQTQVLTVLTNSDGINMNQLTAKSVTVSGVPAGAKVSFYLDSHKGNKHKNHNSLRGESQIIDETVPAGTFFNDETLDKYVLLGCKGAVSSNNEHNDAAFVIGGIGKEDVKDIDGETITEVTEKRYMVEDLGVTDDFDFNDLVLDMKSVQQYKIEGEKLVATGTPEKKGTVRAMGGTMDFTIQIGSTLWTKSENDFVAEVMYNTLEPDYNAVLAVFPAPDWNPAENNIVFMAGGKISKKVMTIKFPKEGMVPLIIAVEPTLDWMKERMPVPNSWWY